jgi:hypothetical protein
MQSQDMLNLSSNRKATLIVLVVAVLLTTTILSIAILNFKAAPNSQSKETENDLQVNIGSAYPGVADLVSASIAKAGSTLNVNISVKDTITPLAEQETAQYNMVLIIENGTDVLQTYELRIDMNSTGLFGVIQDVQTKNQQRIDLEVFDSTLKMSTDFVELNDATQAEWNLNSSYEKVENNQIVVSAWDFIPNQGLTTTIF